MKVQVRPFLQFPPKVLTCGPQGAPSWIPDNRTNIHTPPLNWDQVNISDCLSICEFVKFSNTVMVVTGFSFVNFIKASEMILLVWLGQLLVYNLLYLQCTLDIMLSRYKVYGRTRGPWHEHGWVRNWLTWDRLQSVELNDKHSPWGEILSGVIQGTCLGSAIFLIFIINTISVT